jgi:hypothetical protein
MAPLIREAVEAYLADDTVDVESALEETFGAIPDLEVPGRNEWERGTDPA